MNLYMKYVYRHSVCVPKNLVRIMKLTFAILLIACLQVKAIDSFAQKITIHVENASLNKVFLEISKQSDLNFVYNEEYLKKAHRVSINFVATDAETVLNACFKNQPFTYKISNSTIIVKPAVIQNDLQQVLDRINGKITDNNGDPLIGVAITIKGTSKGTTTDLNGNFALDVQKGDILMLSYLGFKSQEITYNQQKTLNISLETDAKGLNEIIVVGYGTQSRGSVTGAVGKVSFEDIKDQSVPSYDQALVGKIAGVQVSQTTGEPGRGVTFKVRGTGSITAGNGPLVVVDGYPLEAQNQANEFVNPNDIASVEVLKDASAAAIYGSRGANGVVIITTKKGKEGKLKVTYSNITGMQQVSKKIDMLDAYQYAQLAKDGHDNAWVDFKAGNSASTPDVDRGPVENAGYYWNQTPVELYPYLTGVQGLTNTDWQDEIFRNALLTNQSVSFSGGNDKSKFFVNTNYTNQDGVVIQSGYKRYAARVNLDSKHNKFGFGLNLSPSHSREQRINDEGPFSDETVISSALQMAPNWPVYNADGSYNFDGNGKWRIGKDYQHNAVLNPVALANLIDNEVTHTNLLGRLYLNYEILKDLKYEVSLGSTLNDYTSKTYRPSTLPNLGESFYYSPSNPVATNSQTFIYNWVIEHTLNYAKTFGDHSFKFLGGFTAQKSRSEQNNVSATNFPNDLVHTINAGTVTSGSANIQEWSLMSLLSRVQYNYKNKYLATAALRTDGSSRFGNNNKWGYFPSVSGGWRVSSEDFFDNVKAVSDLKLRASYGVTGNFQIGNYDHISRIDGRDYILGAGNGTLASGLVPINISNDQLGWEKTDMVDIGLDIGFFNQSLTVELDWYNKNTSNLLLNVPVPYSSGFGSARQNVGKVNNKGFEVTLAYQHDFNKLKWNVSTNFSTNKNKVVELGPGNAEIIKTSGTGNTFFITQVGAPIGSYYFLKEDGIFKNQAEIDAYPHFSNTKPGDFRFIDVDGDGILDVNKDRTIVGNYFPDFTYGFTNNLKYRNFDFGFSFQGVEGVEIVNLLNRYTNSMEGNFNNTVKALDRWISETEPGDGFTNRANRKAKGNNGRTSNWHVEDGSYLRLQNVVLGYSLPTSITKKIKINNARLFVSGQNLYTWTDYTGFNPEVNNYDGDALTPGIDYGAYPLNRTLSFGLNLNF